MYTEEYEKRGFPLGSFIVKLVLVILFVLLLAWLIPKLIRPAVGNYSNNNSGYSNNTSSSKKCSGGNGNCDMSGVNALTSQIFAQNLDRMKEAAISYYTDERLPKEVGDSDTMTLSDMIGKKIIVALIDKNNKACDVEKSYVKITKADDEYILKVNLKDSEREDYILVHLGCYTYCDSYLCQKQENTDVPVKGSKVTGYVPIKGSVVNGYYYPPTKTTVVVPPTPVPSNPKCEYKDGRYYDLYGRIVSETEFKKSCNVPDDDHYCVKYNGNYYDNTGRVVSYEGFKKACMPEEEHYCVKYNGEYYNNFGKVVSYEDYKKACVPEEPHYCVKYDGNYYDDNGDIVDYAVYKKACMHEEKHYCVKYDGKYYDNVGRIVSYKNFKKACMPEDEHYCVKYNGKYYNDEGEIVSYKEYKKVCMPEVKHYCVKYNGKYYDNNGKVVSYKKYKKACMSDDKHYCVKYNGKYYDDNGKVVSYEAYKKACMSESKHYCVKYNGKYYDNRGKVVSYETYKKACMSEDKHYCVKYNGKYYDKSGNVVDELHYIISCKNPKCQVINNYYFGKNGNKVSKETYEKECKAKEYIYEYKKTTNTSFSKWTDWGAWNKTNCATQEINCSDSSPSCLMKLQVLKRKEKIGTYQKTYVKNRDVIRQTGSYTQKACSKYNYVEINRTLYATTTTTTYTQTNTITSTTQHSTGAWTYNGRASYSNPPRDSASTHYKFAGADYSYCSETCTSLPNYYYDSYSYTGGLTSVSSTTSAGSVSSSSSSTTTVAGQTTTSEASCGEYVTKTIPIYGTITIAEKAYRTEPLYGDVCYASTKTRKITSEGSTKTKWSKYNDTTLLNAGWVYTGKKKQK